MADLNEIMMLAKTLVKADGFLPSHLKTEGQIAAVILAGHELGIPPMAAIRGIKLVKGNVTLDAALQLGCIVRSGAKFAWIHDGSDGVAEAVFERPGQDPYVSRYTTEMAKRAGLDGDNWRKHPAAMLRARVVTAAGKAYFPDVLAGVYLPDELEDSAPVESPKRAPRSLADVASKPSLTDIAVAGIKEAAMPALPFVEVAALPAGETQVDLGEMPRFAEGEYAGLAYDEVPVAVLQKLLKNKRFCEDQTRVHWANEVVRRHEQEMAGS
jgi:hypothetical protein